MILIINRESTYANIHTFRWQSNTFIIIKKTESNYGSLIATGIVAMFFFHFIVNVGMVMGIMPITGIPLLFLSYGGSSLWTAMIATGLLISINMRRLEH